MLPIHGGEGRAMARTPLARRLQETVSAIGEARARGVPVEQVQEERTTRRELLVRAGTVGAAAAAASSVGRFARAAHGATAPRIAIVGAGLAGLTCAYRLQQAGHTAQVYEAHPTRVGGRCYSDRTSWGGQVTEHGGELLDLLGYSGQGQLNIFGPSNEKYHVVGGNDQVPNELARRLSGQVTMGAELVSISSNPSRTTWTLTFKGAKPVTADHVVLALPFSILRSS